LKEHDLIDLSTTLISDLYSHKLDHALDYIDDDVMCVGQFENMIFRGKDELLKKINMEPKDLHITLSTIISHTHRTSTKNIDIIMSFKIYFSREGSMFEHNQIVHLTWAEKVILTPEGVSTKEPRIVSIHISNVSKMENQDYEPILKNPFMSPPEIMLARTEQGMRVQVIGLDRATYFFLPSTIKWIESCDAGQHSCIHLIDREVICVNNISSIAAAYEDILIRTHESYLVNPCFVTSIKRFSLTILGGIELPIPERKYTAVKKQIQTFFK